MIASVSAVPPSGSIPFRLVWHKELIMNSNIIKIMLNVNILQISLGFLLFEALLQYDDQK